MVEQDVCCCVSQVGFGLIDVVLAVQHYCGPSSVCREDDNRLVPVELLWRSLFLNWGVTCNSCSFEHLSNANTNVLFGHVVEIKLVET